MPILGYTAPSVKQDLSGNPVTAKTPPKDPDGIYQVCDAFVSEPEYRKAFLKDPNAALAKAGINVGGAVIKASYSEINAGKDQKTGSGHLLIHVENGGANWCGTATVVINK